MALARGTRIGVYDITGLLGAGAFLGKVEKKIPPRSTEG
jgi:hypothetical protein